MNCARGASNAERRMPDAGRKPGFSRSFGTWHSALSILLLGTLIELEAITMFLDRLMNSGPAPVIERMVQFTGARHKVLAENIVNSSTPGYKQKDLSLPAFQKALTRRMEQRARSPKGTVSFDDLSAEIKNPRAGILFHDRNNRSMETLMSDFSSNALKHNMYTEMMRKQFDKLDMVLKDRIA